MAIRSNPPAEWWSPGTGLRREEIRPNPGPDLERHGCAGRQIDMEYPVPGMIGIRRFPTPGPVPLPAGRLTNMR